MCAFVICIACLSVSCFGFVCFVLCSFPFVLFCRFFVCVCYVAFSVCCDVLLVYDVELCSLPCLLFCHDVVCLCSGLVSFVLCCFLYLFVMWRVRFLIYDSACCVCVCFLVFCVL